MGPGSLNNIKTHLQLVTMNISVFQPSCTLQWLVQNCCQSVAAMTEFWLISAPGEKTCQQTWDKMMVATTKTNNISTNNKFNIPDLKVCLPFLWRCVYSLKAWVCWIRIVLGCNVIYILNAYDLDCWLCFESLQILGMRLFNWSSCGDHSQPVVPNVQKSTHLASHAFKLNS